MSFWGKIFCRIYVKNIVTSPRKNVILEEGISLITYANISIFIHIIYTYKIYVHVKQNEKPVLRLTHSMIHNTPPTIKLTN